MEKIITVMDSLYIIWIIAAIVFLVIELSAGNFVMICFSIGAVSAMLTALFGFSLTIQVIIFALSAVASIFFLRPIIAEHFNKGGRKSNADAMIGRTGKVTEAIEKDGFGRIALDGDVWKAQTIDGLPVASDTNVRIIGRKSTIVIVEPLNKIVES